MSLFMNFERYSSLLYYTHKHIPIVNSLSKDLYYGSRTPAGQGWFIDSNQFQQAAKHQPVYIAVRDVYLNLFTKATSNIHFCQVFQSDDLILFTNEQADCYKQLGENHDNATNQLRRY